jgi:hypothetical protein
MDRHGNVLGAKHLPGLDHLPLLLDWDSWELEIGTGRARFDEADLDALGPELLGQRLAEARDAELDPGVDCRMWPERVGAAGIAALMMAMS